jgi:predicted dienelactone hydrolase
MKATTFPATYRRYRLVIVNHGEDAWIQDTNSPQFGVRGASCMAVRVQPIAAARAQCQRMNAAAMDRG